MLVGLSVPYCELFAGRFDCKETSDYTAKSGPITCGCPIQLGVRISVSSLFPIYRSALMVNPLETDRVGIFTLNGGATFDAMCHAASVPVCWAF